MLAKKKDQLFLYSVSIKLSVNDKGIIVAKMRLNDGNTSSFNTVAVMLLQGKGVADYETLSLVNKMPLERVAG